MKSFLTFLLLVSLPLLAPGAPARAAPPAVTSLHHVSRPASPSAVTPAYHVVRPGETIKKIAAVYGIRPAQLRAWNSIRKPYQPVPDGVLHLAEPPIPLTGWRSRIELVTPPQVNWDPRRKCPVPPADLRRVWVTYIDFYGVAHSGSITVNKSIATGVQRAFLSLYRFRFRIQGMSPMTINAPWINDMGAVTAGYSCRTVAGSATLSQHAYGLAIDVNPVQNPMHRGTYLDPSDSTSFLARNAYRRGMMHPGGAVVAFTANGLKWGGRWRSLKDYMHFSLLDK